MIKWIKTLQLVFLAGVSLYIISCSATGPEFQPVYSEDDSKALVYIYRPWRFCNSAGKTYLYINDTKLLNMRNQGYTWFNVEPGTHVLKNLFVRTKKPDLLLANFELETKANHTYYFRYDLACHIKSIGPVGGAGAKGRFVLVEESKALEEIKECRYQESNPIVESSTKGNDS